MDKLKKYLRDHEVEMEFDVPDDTVWERIEADFPAEGKGRTITLIRRLAVAACLAGAIGTGAWWWFSRNENKIVKMDPPAAPGSVAEEKDSPRKDTGNYVTAPEIAEADPPVNGSERITNAQVRSSGINKKEAPVNTEVATISDGYTKLINHKLKELRSTAIHAENPAYFSLFTTRFRKMEKDEQRLKADMKKYGVTDELLEQLINLYQQKLNILRSLQAEIKKMNNNVIENKGAIPKSSKYYLNI